MMNNDNKQSFEKSLSELEQVVKALEGSEISLDEMIALFEKAEAEQDDNGLWQINLACTQSAMDII